MDLFEYKVVPAPRKAKRIKGAKGPAARFAANLEQVINELAASGWQYLRAESLPVDERQGITIRKTETYQNVLIFRKPAETAKAEAPIAGLLEDKPSDKPMQDTASEDLPEEIVDNVSEEGAEDTPEDENIEATNKKTAKKRKSKAAGKTGKKA